MQFIKVNFQIIKKQNLAAILRKLKNIKLDHSSRLPAVMLIIICTEVKYPV